MPVTGVAILQNVVIPTRKLEDSITFYRDILGLKTYREGQGFCFLEAGAVCIAIHTVSGVSVFAPSGHGIYLDMKVNDVQKLRDQLLRAGIQIAKEWEDKNGQFLLVSDPDGDLLELYQPAILS